MESKMDMSFGSEDLEEEVMYAESGTAEDNEFDMIVGALEEVMLNDEFATTQKNFCDKHCNEFTDAEENTASNMETFAEFARLIENYLETALAERVPGFRMNKFEEMLTKRQDEISGEIFDMLLSLGDYSEFKQMMLSHKAEKNGGGGGLAISGTHLSARPL